MGQSSRDTGRSLLQNQTFCIFLGQRLFLIVRCSAPTTYHYRREQEGDARVFCAATLQHTKREPGLSGEKESPHCPIEWWSVFRLSYTPLVARFYIQVKGAASKKDPIAGAGVRVASFFVPPAIEKTDQ